MNNIKLTLIFADINISITDGSTIWLSNLINTLNNENKFVYFFNIYKITNNYFNRNIINKDLFKIIKCESIHDVKKKLEFFNNKNKIEDIIIRSNQLLNTINNDWNILNLITFYGLDIHLENIKKLDNKYKELWTQSDKLKKLFILNGINENKIKITPPIAWKYNFNLLKRIDNDIRLIYVGTIRDEENILEMIEEFKKIYIIIKNISLKIVYGKIHGNKDFVEKINKIIKENIKGIIFMKNLSHIDTCYQIATSDIGICWRKNGWGENGEISTKEKEYKIYGLKIIKKLSKEFFITQIIN